MCVARDKLMCLANVQARVMKPIGSGAMLCCELGMLRSFGTYVGSDKWIVHVPNVAGVLAVIISTLVLFCTVLC